MQTIYFKYRLRFFITFIALCIVQSAVAQPKSMSIRMGVPVNDNDTGFRQYEMFADFPITKITGSQNGLRFGMRLDVVTSLLEQSDKWAFLLSVGPSFVLSNAGSRLALKFGSSPTFLSNARFPHKNLGGHFHFISHIGVSLRLTSNMAVVYRIQHLSNASTVQPNPGLNLHMFGIGVEF